MQTLDREVVKLPLDGQPPVTQHELPVLCPTILSAFISGEEATIAFHPSTMKLFINARLFQIKVTSVAVSPRFLSFTCSTDGLSHLMYNFDLTKSLPTPKANEQVPDLLTAGFGVRAVERGSKIVHVDIDGIRTVLQMPRGNLEGVYPRVITLQKAIELVDSQQYGEALEILR